MGISATPRPPNAPPHTVGSTAPTYRSKFHNSVLTTLANLERTTYWPKVYIYASPSRF